MSLLNEPTMPERQRAQEGNHIRTIEVQMLDALLRIEELLVNLNECLAGPRGPKEEPEDRGNYEERHTPGTKTGYSPAKRKPNPRQL